MAKRVYATISLLMKTRSLRSSLARHLRAASPRMTEKNGLFGLHCSTRGRLDSLDLEAHLDLLLREHSNLPVLLNNLPDDPEAGLHVRLWIFFDADRENEDFALSQRVIAWLSAMYADVCVDVWADA